MDELQDLYRDLILDHYRSPRNRGVLPAADIDMEGVNPSCGDQLHLTVKIADGKVEDLRFDGKGCSISQSSASMMTEALKGKTLTDGRAASDQFKKMMLANASADELPEDMEDLAALEGVKKYPVRIKCALLAWNTLLEGLAVFEESQQKVVAKHEES